MDPDLRQKIEAAGACLRNHGATAVYVFGSAVRGELRDDSDVDLAVEGLPAAVFFRAMAQASRIVGRAVDLLSLDLNPVLKREVLASGEIDRVA